MWIYVAVILAVLLAIGILLAWHYGWQKADADPDPFPPDYTPPDEPTPPVDEPPGDVEPPELGAL